MTHVEYIILLCLLFFFLGCIVVSMMSTLMPTKEGFEESETPDYYVSTLCIGERFEPVRPHWEKRVQETTQNAAIVVYDETNVDQLPISRDDYAWWDVLRMKKNIELLQTNEVPVVHCDLDLILVKDITPIIQLPHDMIVSMEHYGEDAFPKECSQKLGFGLCTGFYVLKPTCLEFIEGIYSNMLSKKYGSHSDQVCLMNHITKSKHYTVHNEVIILEGVSFTNKIIVVDGITICVLDFDLITRDPVRQNNQYGNHIHIPNAGSTEEFIRFFYEDIENLPDITAYY